MKCKTRFTAYIHFQPTCVHRAEAQTRKNETASFQRQYIGHKTKKGGGQSLPCIILIRIHNALDFWRASCDSCPRCVVAICWGLSNPLALGERECTGSIASACLPISIIVSCSFSETINAFGDTAGLHNVRVLEVMVSDVVLTGLENSGGTIFRW